MLYKDFMKDRTECPFCGNRQEQILKLEYGYLTYSLAPYTKHHLMVVVNRHIESVIEMTEAEVLEVNTLERIALDVLHKLGYTNATFLVREGVSGDKSVPHVHFHVIPKIAIATVETDARERRIMTEEEVEETIADIKKSL
ncbi:MAG: HIT domain-containing protein [Candidatus Pacebacteria bacterium]|nr:HIT domain-containing protein [Candidatus Paceibacterota bacterium]